MLLERYTSELDQLMEQGHGDSIQFFRYIPLLVQSGARILLEIHPSLIPLFSPWRNTIRFIATGAPLLIVN
jgi:folate-dependent phosphoribosylglycinamide formyltransferase PurN